MTIKLLLHELAFQRLLNSVNPNFNRQIQAVGAFARQAGANKIRIEVQHQNPDEPAFIRAILDTNIPFRADRLFPHLWDNTDISHEPASPGLLTLAANNWGITSTDPETDQYWHAEITPNHISGTQNIEADNDGEDINSDETIITWTHPQPHQTTAPNIDTFLKYENLPYTLFIERAHSYEEATHHPQDFLAGAYTVCQTSLYRLGLFKTQNYKYDNQRPNINCFGELFRLELPQAETIGGTCWHIRVNGSRAHALLRHLRKPSNQAGINTKIRHHLYTAVQDFLCKETKAATNVRFNSTAQ